MHDGSLLALSGERKLSIESRGVGQLEFRLDRVTPASINHLVSQTSGDFQSPVFGNYNFDESNICEHIVRGQSIAASDTSKNDYSALDFSRVRRWPRRQSRQARPLRSACARARGRQGRRLLQAGRQRFPRSGDASAETGGCAVSQWRAGRPDGGRRRARRPAPRSRHRSRLIIKDNADGTHDVFVQSIKTGESVGDVRIDVLGKNGVPVVSVTTDDSGHAAVSSLNDFKRDKKPVAYVAHRGDDVSFLPFDRQDRVLNFSRFDISGVTGLAPHDLTAFVFTDRGIYRPGDTAQLGLVVKQRDWQENSTAFRCGSMSSAHARDGAEPPCSSSTPPAFSRRRSRRARPRTPASTR